MSFAEWTSLPNLHPAVIHFPIVLLATALVIDAIALALRRQTWLDRMGTMLWALGAAAAGAAYLTGSSAADGLGLVLPEVESAIARHSDLAWWTVLCASALGVLRLLVGWVARTDESIQRLGTRMALLAVGVGVVGLVFVTADRGGTLVYKHGVAVAALAKAAPSSLERPAPPHLTPQDRLTRLEDGGLVWSPLPGDAVALGEVVEFVAEPGGAIAVEDPAEAPGEGLPLRIDGRAILLLPGEFGDVQVKAVLDLSSFNGSAGVLHHYRDAVSYGSFEVAERTCRLIHRKGAEPQLVEDGDEFDAQGVVTIAVSSVGSHIKGFVGDKTVAHSHLAAPPPGRTGLLLEGLGTVRVRELRVQRIKDH